MKILILGGGGREHALAWSLRRSARVTELVCAPGNAGTREVARCVPVDVSQLDSMLELIESERPALVVVGPEVPLAVGIVDALGVRGFPAFGPTQAAARLEISKGFAKDFMRRWAIPTAAYALCHSLDELRAALPAFAAKVVVKADGLAAGKGVVLCQSHAEAERVADEIFSGALGFAASSLVLEETLEGEEVSFFALCDGRTAVLLGLAQDHKRVGEGDTGPNTGGMGAYSTDDLLPPATCTWVLEQIAQRTVDGMAAEGNPFTGVLFIGLMVGPGGPKVLEFNTRFGDPETEAILPRLETDLLEALEAAVEQRLAGLSLKLRPGAGACVVAASAGYPGSYHTGKVVTGLEQVSGVEVFHAGTAVEGDQMVTTGGRVLVVAATGATLAEALVPVYRALEEISFEGMFFRRDIGWRSLGRGSD